ncbi:MAG: hypothetical protein V7749_05400 [Cocleimonas sp.]
MNNRITKIKTAFATKPSNAFILFLTGFFFVKTMLLIMLYSSHPYGGWETGIGTFTTSSILMSSILVLSLCLIALWRSASTTKRSQVELSIPEYMLAPAY